MHFLQGLLFCLPTWSQAPCLLDHRPCTRGGWKHHPSGKTPAEAQNRRLSGSPNGTPRHTGLREEVHLRLLVSLPSGGHCRLGSNDQGGLGPENTGKAPVGGYSFLSRKISLSHIFFLFEKKGILSLKSTGDCSIETSLPLPSQENIVTLPKKKKKKDTRNRKVKIKEKTTLSNKANI